MNLNIIDVGVIMTETDYCCLLCAEIEHAKKKTAESIRTGNAELTFTAMDVPFLPVIPPHVISLNCDSNELTYLPKLPSRLEVLDCWSNQLTELPDLPNSLQLLFVGNNYLTHLPKLPFNLRELYCGSNQLIKLPDLPPLLEILICDNNYLFELPILPVSLKELSCRNNPFLTVSEEIRERFNLEQQPNHKQIVGDLKKMIKARQRIRRLVFCDKLQIGIDSYIYRPDGMGYLRLKILNQGRFADT